MDNFEDLNILICDDSITNVLILTKLVESEISAGVVTLTDPREIAATLAEQRIDLILLDLEMPHLNGFEVMQQVRKTYESDQLPIIIITGTTGLETRNHALECGANDFINKPVDQVEVILRVKNLLKIRVSYLLHEKYNQILEQKIQLRTKQLNKSIHSLLHSLAVAGELKDDDTGKHVIRVGKYARILAEGYGLPAELVNMIEQTAPLHDIGKIGIPDKILLKAGKLDKAERLIMDKHTIFAEALIGSNDSDIVQMARVIALSHHERWDGKGYPSKLRGESIPIEGRITAIADVFDALTTQRSYKEAWPVEEAVNYISASSGHAFDPALVTVFQENISSIIEISKRLAD
ncbi:HD domain-containing phosphohydrolase [Psychromonas ossibalaenae]|uniref:HD domain-containing phosphohydrolase n=1 Tax=Psychromonas ossibalaenae TaxID=444922 RepID=UPI000367115A|nr:HD domain-containing phosphohydrolase [Psychromonas ossibalaenae]